MDPLPPVATGRFRAAKDDLRNCRDAEIAAAR
jgi:hypothetical protein